MYVRISALLPICALKQSKIVFLFISRGQIGAQTKQTYKYSNTKKCVDARILPYTWLLHSVDWAKPTCVLCPSEVNTITSQHHGDHTVYSIFGQPLPFLKLRRLNESDWSLDNEETTTGLHNHQSSKQTLSIFEYTYEFGSQCIWYCQNSETFVYQLN